MEKDLISCVVPTYKRSDTLVRAVNSILAQTYKNLEVLVVDDNEPDDENSLLVQKRLQEEIHDERVHYIQQKKHINGAVARNVGIKKAKGEYIAFLDDDDEWEPMKLEKQLETLKGLPKEYGGVSCYYKLYKDGKPFRKCPPYSEKNLHRKVLERTVAMYTSTLLLKKECLDKAGYFDESLKRHQDIQLLLDFLAVYKIAVVNEYYVKLDTDIGGNRPDTKGLIEVKNQFFKQTKRHFDRYEKKERKRIYAAHYFEIAFLALKEKKLGTAFKYVLKIGINPKAFKQVLGRYKKRSQSAI